MIRLPTIFRRFPNLLDISNYTFGLGSVVSTLMRIPVLSQIVAIPVMVLSLIYFIGYGTWYIGSLIHHKSHPRKMDSWYGFAEFRQQHQIAALLGTIAALICFLIPTLIAPTAWLYVISNIFWSIGAHHLKNMPDTTDPTYSTAKQTVFCYLTIAVTGISFITAISATILALLPLSAPILLPIAAGVSATLSLITFAILIKYYASDYKPDMSQGDALKTSAVDLNDGVVPHDKKVPKNNRHVTFRSPLESSFPSATRPVVTNEKLASVSQP